MRIRTIAYLGHKDTLLLSTIKKARPKSAPQPANKHAGQLCLGEGTALHPSDVSRTRTVPVIARHDCTRD